MYELLSGWSTALEGSFRHALEVGSPLTFVFALLGGMLAAATPCVLPMIPVTVTTIGAHTDGDRRRALTLATLFAFGIALNCAVIGAVAAALGGSVVDVARSPWATGIVGVVCLVMALAMFDAVSVPMPGFLQRFQSKQRLRKGYAGALASGFVFGVLAYACLAPIVALISGLVFRTGRIAYGSALMGTFGLGLGVPFILLGAFTGAITSVLRHGQWMERVKRGFGWAMLALGAVFLFQAGSQQMKAALAASTAEAGGRPDWRPDFSRAYADLPGPRLKPGLQPGLHQVSVAGMPTVSLVTPGSGDPVQVGQEAPLFTWTDSVSGRTVSLEDLRDKPVWISFFAEWCHNCAEEVPLLNRIKQQYGDRIRVIGVDYGDDRAVVQEWVKQHGVEYGILLDRGEKVLTDGYGQIGVPYNVVIDTTGTIRFSSTGTPKDPDQVIRDALDE